MTLARAQLIQHEASLTAAQPYTLALAAQIEKLPADHHWADFRRILERAYVLVGLEAASDSYSAARRSGLSSNEQFQRAEFEVEAGPFLDAIAEFEGRIPRLASEVKTLLAEAEQIAGNVVEAEISGAVQAALGRTELGDRILRGSFWVTGTTGGQLLDLRSVLAGIMRGELGSKELRQMGVADFVNEVQARGIRNLTSARLETIYRNNLSSVYSETAARTMERNDVAEVMPLVMLNEIRDRRTRGNPNGLYPNAGFHWQMDKFIGTMPDFRRLGLIPPNGHGCRAGIRGITIGEAVANGWMNNDGQIDRVAVNSHNGARLSIIERGDYPDPGFKGG